MLPHLPKASRKGYLTHALQMAHAIRWSFDRISALGDLIPHLNGSLRGTTLHKMFNDVIDLEDLESAAHVWSSVCPHLASDQLSQALAAIRRMNRVWQVSHLASIARYLPELSRTELCREVLSLIRKQNQFSGADDLEHLVPALTDGLLESVLPMTAFYRV
jgi:hypothetical protein